jgi:putative DNA primase/helicase
MNDYTIKINAFDKAESLLDAMAAVNLPWPGNEEPLFDGQFRTFCDPESSSRPISNKAAWVKGEVLPDSGIKVAVFGSFRRPEAGPWHWSSEPLTLETKEELDRVKREAEADRRRLHEEAAIAAKAEWEAAAVVKGNEHPYLLRKNVSSHGLLRVKDNILLVPLKDVDGKLHTLTRIWPDGVKRNFPNGDSKKHFCTIGPKPTKEIIVATGVATALSCFAARGVSTCAVGADSNLAAVVKVLRERFPTIALTIAADLGAGGQKAAMAALRAAGTPARIVSPTFAQEAAQNSDFNDLFLAEGLAVVQQQLVAPTAGEAQAKAAGPDPVKA